MELVETYKRNAYEAVQKSRAAVDEAIRRAWLEIADKWQRQADKRFRLIESGKLQGEMVSPPRS